jgi:FKBP-type peptidyl-prolyl cis-trans isomerase FklB
MRVTMAAVVAFAVLGVALATPVAAGDISRRANAAYLAAYAKKPGVIARPSGLLYRIIKTGSGETPAPTDIVTMLYKGTLVDGYVFDSTKGDQTKDLPANAVIPGWQEALSLMKVGDEWEIVIPIELAYGETGGDSLTSGQVLTFDMQLVGVKHARR